MQRRACFFPSAAFLFAALFLALPFFLLRLGAAVVYPRLVIAFALDSNDNVRHRVLFPFSAALFFALKIVFCFAVFAFTTFRAIEHLTQNIPA